MEIEVYLSIEVNVDPMTSTKPEKSDISSLEKSCFWLISWLRLKFKPSQVKPKLKKKSQNPKTPKPQNPERVVKIEKLLITNNSLALYSCTHMD